MVCPSMMTNVNYISPYIFTETLLPLMSSIALSDPESDVRIVNVSSNAHKFLPSSPPIKFTDVEDFCPEYTGKLGAALMRYGHSKLIEILWTKHLQHRLDSSTPPVPIIVISIHPGAVDTYSDRYPIARLLKPLLYGADRGSHTSIFAAAGKIVKEKAGVYKGQYLVNNPVGKIVRPTKPADDEQLAEDLYQLTRKFLDGIGL
ncbi:hypothetical protein VNI00_008689 [Paramarasmius palmivorus]|uniref:Uncharacterized protein n=1 Tax=Paramarasmius palmivorus TaxID=297713 RepID=A0AAW0CYU1_9AGAR